MSPSPPGDLGTRPLGAGGRIDFASLRRVRLERALAELERDDLDAVLLGREANIRFVSDTRRLWTTGARAFAPSCAVVREGPAIHVLTTWDDGVPPEIPREHLYPIRWNPRNLMSDLARIPGLTRAARIGVDGMTPLFAALLSATFPRAEWVDAAPTLLRARAHKAAEEVACLRTATALAEGALAAMVDEIRPGADERALAGRFAEEAARLGAPIQALEPSFRASPRDRRRGGLAAGDLVACHAGVLYAGYEGAVGTTIRCAVPPERGVEGPLGERLARLRRALRERCRPGATVGELGEAYAACDEPLPPFPILHGQGLGVEPPLAGSGGDPDGDARLSAGMVLALLARVSDPERGDAFARETLHVTHAGYERLDALA